MPQDKFLIAPLTDGSQTNLKPWLIPDKAFALLRNMYTWRGSVKKRFGSRYMNESKAALLQQLFSRLRMQVGTINGGTGLGAGTVPGTKWKIGQMFSIVDNDPLVGTVIFTVWQAAGTMLSTNPARAGVYDTTTGVFGFAGFSLFASPIFWYPAEPVVQLATYAVNAINDEVLVAIDTQFAYQFDYTLGWSSLGPTPSARNTPFVAGSAEWTPGTTHLNDKFYWTTNYRAGGAQNWAMFVTNNTVETITVGPNLHQLDGIKYWDGTNWTTIGTFATTPIDAVSKYVATSGSMIQFKGRLLLGDVTIGTVGAPDTYIRYPNMIVFSKEGSPVAVDSWRFDTPGLGNFLIAPVQEAIIGMQYLKDQLIVLFENSTWELIFTGNQINPYRFQQINLELGVESFDSIVPFDKYVFGIGANGINACNGLNVQRIDEIIPYTVFDISNAQLGPYRVNGIRDYFVELVYWAYPSSDAQDNFSFVYPNRVIVYDYINQTWAYNDDSITALGNYQFNFSFTWADIDNTWQQMEGTWADPSLTNRFKSIIAGNQEGFTFIVDTNRSNNARVLSINNITVVDPIVTITAIEHNLPNGSYVYLDNIQANPAGTMTSLNGSFPATQLANGGIYQITVTGTDTFTIQVAGITGTYTGGGTIARVSELQILTKQYNFYNEVGSQLATSKVDFYVDRTTLGQFTVDFYVSASDLGLLQDSSATGTLVGTSVVETSPLALAPLETTQNRFWHSVYFQAQGENIQLNMYQSPAQLMNTQIAFADFQLNAMLFHATRTSEFTSV